MCIGTSYSKPLILSNKQMHESLEGLASIWAARRCCPPVDGDNIVAWRARLLSVMITMLIFKTFNTQFRLQCCWQVISFPRFVFRDGFPLFRTEFPGFDYDYVFFSIDARWIFNSIGFLWNLTEIIVKTKLHILLIILDRDPSLTVNLIIPFK